MVAWLKRAWRKLTGSGPGTTTTVVESHVCLACGQTVPAKTIETPDYENWQPAAKPPKTVEREVRPTDHVYSTWTWYSVSSAPAGSFNKHAAGEGNPDSFAILRSSRKLPDQVDEKGARIRQLDLDRLEDLAEKCHLLASRGETPLENVFDLDRLSDEEFKSLWLDGNDGDMAYWSARPDEEAG